MPDISMGSCQLAQVLDVLQGFEDLRKKRRFYDKLLANTEDSGFATPTPIQRQVLPLLLHHREVLAVAPTGDLCSNVNFPQFVEFVASCALCTRSTTSQAMWVMALCETQGSGKTLAYLLPIIIHAKVAAMKSHQGIKALVMSPTRELAEQITRILLRLVQGLHLSCCLINTAAAVAGTDFSKVRHHAPDVYTIIKKYLP